MCGLVEAALAHYYRNFHITRMKKLTTNDATRALFETNSILICLNKQQCKYI